MAVAGRSIPFIRGTVARDDAGVSQEAATEGHHDMMDAELMAMASMLDRISGDVIRLCPGRGYEAFYEGKDVAAHELRRIARGLRQSVEPDRSLPRTIEHTRLMRAGIQSWHP